MAYRSEGAVVRLIKRLLIDWHSEGLHPDAKFAVYQLQKYYYLTVAYEITSA